MKSPGVSIWTEPTVYIPNYRDVDKARNERHYMLNEDTPDIDFLGSLSNETIENLLKILKEEQQNRKD